MSGARPSVREPRERLEGRPRRERPLVRPHRRRARSREQLLRLDVAIGVLAAIVLLVLSPGLAVTGFIALVLLLAVFGSIALERRRRMRAQARERERRERLAARERATR